MEREKRLELLARFVATRTICQSIETSANRPRPRPVITTSPRGAIDADIDPRCEGRENVVIRRRVAERAVRNTLGEDLIGYRHWIAHRLRTWPNLEVARYASGRISNGDRAG